MNPDYSSAVQIMIVGMFTVFVILSIVVFLGGFLIRIVNHYSKEELSSSKEPPLTIPSSTKKIAAISAAVQIASSGKAKVVQVQKVS